MTSMARPEPWTIKQQADYVEALLMRFTKLDPSSGRVWISFGPDEAEALRALATRLGRMAPHEREIRRVVTRR